MKKLRKNLSFRAWFYFRQGWATYFAFIFAGINTLTVTYYLAIERLSFLQEVFPSFLTYVLIITFISIPTLVIVGYVHYRRSPAYGSEAEIVTESNPYFYKAAPGWQREVMFPTLLKITEHMVKSSKNEKYTEEELNEINELQKKLNKLVKGEMIGSPRKTKDVFVDENDKTKISD